MREVEPLPNPVKFGAVSAGLGAIAISVLLIAAIEIGLRKTEGRALAARQDRSGAPGLGNLLPAIIIHTPLHAIRMVLLLVRIKGGGDGIYLRNHGRAVVGSHGHLRS
jgi:hypothetical protein